MTAIRGAVESLRAFGAVFANPSLRRLQLAGIGSTIGTWAYGVGLAVYAYESGGAKTVGLVYFARWGAAALDERFSWGSCFKVAERNKL